MTAIRFAWRAVVVAAAVALAPEPALAASAPPDAWSVGTATTEVICGIAVSAPGTPPSRLLCSASAIPPPKGGDGDPGFVFLAGTRGPSLARLSQDEFLGSTFVKLGTGSTWSRFGVTCRVTAATVRCLNRLGFGFMVGAGAYTSISPPLGPQRAQVRGEPAWSGTADWKTMSVPAAACGTSRSVSLVNGSATASSTRWRAAQTITLNLAAVTTGTIAGVRADATAVEIMCDAPGGMADDELGNAWVVYVAVAGELHLAGVVTPRDVPETPGLNASLVGSVAITPGRVTATEVWYRPADMTCCPTGKATSIWIYHDGTLGFERTTLER